MVRVITLIEYFVEVDIDKTLDFIKRLMLSREFLTERGYCCGHGCLMCPYEPKHTKDNTILKVINCFKEDNPLIQKKLRSVSVEEGYEITTKTISST